MLFVLLLFSLSLGVVTLVVLFVLLCLSFLLLFSTIPQDQLIIAINNNFLDYHMSNIIYKPYTIYYLCNYPTIIVCTHYHEHYHKMQRSKLRPQSLRGLATKDAIITTSAEAGAVGGGCSGWGVVLCSRIVHNTVQNTTPCFHCTPLQNVEGGGSSCFIIHRRHAARPQPLNYVSYA